METDFFSDLNDVIFDTMEFIGASQHIDVDGKQMQVIFDNDQLKRRQDKSGISQGEKLIFVRASEFSVKPVPGRQMRVDRQLFVVAECVEQDGMLEITLTTNRS